MKTVNDIKLLVNSFYDKVKADTVIGYIFNDIAKVDWEKHLPVMYDFWENVLFFTGYIQSQSHYTTYKPAPGYASLTKEHFSEVVTTFYFNS